LPNDRYGTTFIGGVPRPCDGPVIMHTILHKPMSCEVFSVKSSYWFCVGLLAVSLIVELVFFVQVPIGLALDRVLLLIAVTAGVLLFSNIARYAGAAFLGLSALYTVYAVVSAPIAVGPALAATIVVGTGLEIIAAYFLAFSGSFSREFRERRGAAPAAVARIRLSVLILLAVLAIVLTVHDLIRLLLHKLAQAE
jgi:hypothetical protein